jgi:glycosyltransferase involved in cell wall biosynthesis
MAPNNLRVAIVHDWLTSMGGAEPTVLEIAKLFPNAPIYTSVYDYKKMSAFHHRDVRTAWLQKIPGTFKFKHTLFPVLRAYAFRRLDLREFDLVISSSSAEAKAIKKRPDALHICYCHTPTRYYWSHYQEFRKEFSFGFLTLFVRPFIPFFVRWMRKKDLQAAAGVDVWLANSQVTKQRIKKYYNATARVIHPPVQTKKFIASPATSHRDGYIIWGRHVPYKRFDLAIQACNKLGKKLTVIGEGPDTARLKRMAGPTITFVGRVSDAELIQYAHQAKYFFLPNEEDFGISAVEALAAGLAIVAYKKGGALDIVEDGVSGIFFEEQTINAVTHAMQAIEKTFFSTNTLVQRAKRFDVILFQTKLKKIIIDNVESLQ